MVKLRQFVLLVWKNFILQKRRPIATCVELILPLFFSALLVIIRTTVDTTTHDKIKRFREFPVNSMPSFNPDALPGDNTFQVAFVPNNNPTMDNIVRNFEEFLKDSKSDLEIACPGVSILLDGSLRLFESQASTFSIPIPTITAATAGLVLSSFPAYIQDFLRDEAGSVNETTNEYVAQQYNTLGAQRFATSVIDDFRNDTMECAFAFLGPRARDVFDSANGSAPRNSSDSALDQSFGRVPEIKAISFPDVAAFDEFVANDTNLAKTLGGVIFSQYMNGSEPNFSYLIRLHSDPLNINPADTAAFTGDPDTWETNSLFPGFQIPEPRAVNDIYGGKPGYYKEGFLSVMHAVDMAILATLSNTSVRAPENQNLRLKRFPYPPYIEDRFLIAISSVLPLLLMLSFFYTALVIVKSIVHEKETKLKEYLMMTGLSNWLHWLAWFTKYIAFLTISCILITILYKIPTPRGKVLTFSDGSVLFVYLLSFSAATICFCFMISVFFKKANVAAAAGGVIYGLSYMPYLFISPRYGQLSWSVKAVSGLLSNIAMANGAMVLSMYEGSGVGVQWYNLNTPVTVDDNFTMLHALVFLWIDAILYMAIAWYVEGVKPGEYGIPKPWYFPCTKSYWCGNTVESDEYQVPINSSGEMLTPPGTGNGEIKNFQETEFFETEVPGLNKIVQIHGLHKVFNPGPKEKIAVDSLDLNMFEGQITVLLGHNGAGKTTTMSMLTGLFPPTSGFANVLGHNITTDIDSARKSMGLCPQHDILYDQLTVDEHLYFFSRLKGLSPTEAKAESKKMLSVLQLTDKKHALAKTLSGGMKRKLSVGLAICAGSKFIVLDEPTAGMDPAARRAIWDILQQYRSQCSMLLSTHFMDEADLLGDRIAIMADGKLRCAGSSAFLKNKFGVGYHVVMNKTTNCDVQQLTNVFRSHVPESRLERTAAAEISFLLPFESSHLFQKLFMTLDEQMESLGILSYGASITTMEEVFLAVTEDVQKPVASVNRTFSVNSDVRPQESPSRASSDVLKAPGHPVTGLNLWFLQFGALFIKRVIHTKRNWKVGLAQILIPVLFVIIAIVNAKYSPFLEKNIERPLTLNAYGMPNYVRYNESADVGGFGDVYSSQFSGIAEPIRYQGDLGTYLADTLESTGGGFNQRNVIAAALQNNREAHNSTIAYFNAQAYHTSANTLLYADQSYIRWKLNNSDFKLRVSNNPLPRNSSARVQEQLIGSISGFMIAFNLVLGFAFLSASFSIFIVRERTDRASLLQSLTGVDPFCFWFSGFAWDFINFFVPCLICVIVFAAFDVVEYIHNGQIWITLLMFALYCWSSLPLTYLLSYFFTLPTTALVSITIFGAIMGLATIITINVLTLIDDTTREIGDILDWVFLMLPQYCIGQGLADLYTNDKMVNVCTSSLDYETICKALGIDYQINFMAWQRYGVGRFLVFMFAEGLIFFGILFAIEYDVQSLFFRVRRRFLGRVNPHDQTVVNGGSSVDDDVLYEQNRIISSQQYDLAKSDLIWSKRLRKVYSGKKGRKSQTIAAVEELSFGVPKGECFGLLGINGAGKTTTFKMLTGDIRPSQGTAYINNRDIVTNKKLAQQNIGYCPQFDGLIEQMTGWETLQMYARLRGIRNKYIPDMITKLSRLLHFEEYIHKVCGKYSGGNKRKLSTAIALVGGPAVVLLDEPSTGMDPGARRKLWDTISQICTDQRCVILTSHSMEECEALCMRLAIMVNGQFRCLGGPQHLKTKFGQGYSVEIKLASMEIDMAPVKTYLLNTFPGTLVKDEHQGMIAFQVPKTTTDGTNLSLAAIFGKMEEAKQQFQLRDYSVSQTTLEQVFLSFARQQREADDPSP